MLSDKIKTSLLRYWRNRNYIASLEVDTSYGDVEDVMAVKDDHIVVVEVKVSLADLKVDSKKRKHKKIANSSVRNMANHYYFCVPLDLRDKALSYVEKHYPSFGLMIYNEEDALVETVYYGRRRTKPYIKMGGKPICVVKRAKRVTKSFSRILSKNIISSMSNRLTRLMELKFYIEEDNG